MRDCSHAALTEVFAPEGKQILFLSAEGAWQFIFAKNDQLPIQKDFYRVFFPWYPVSAVVRSAGQFCQARPLFWQYPLLSCRFLLSIRHIWEVCRHDAPRYPPFVCFYTFNYPVPFDMDGKTPFLIIIVAVCCILHIQTASIFYWTVAFKSFDIKTSYYLYITISYFHAIARRLSIFAWLFSNHSLKNEPA